MPMGEYKDFDDCVKKNQDKPDPKAYCGAIKQKAEAEAKKNMDKLPPGTRMLNASLGIPKYMEAPNGGGFIVKDVPLLATGQWTDSFVGTPLFYGKKVLERDAKNWIANGVWSRHAGGAPRRITDKVGEVRNQHYDGGAVVGDLWLHERTQTSRDVADMIRDGLVSSVSVEVGTTDAWNAEAKRYEAASLEFYGLAIVDRGACEVCKIKRNEAGEEVCEAEPEAEDTQMETTTKEEKKVVEAEAPAPNLAKELEDAKVAMAKATEESTALKEKLASAEKELAEAKTKIVELGKAPAPRTLATPPETQKEVLDVPPMKIVVRNGQVYRA